MVERGPEILDEADADQFDERFFPGDAFLRLDVPECPRELQWTLGHGYFVFGLSRFWFGVRHELGFLPSRKLKT